MVLPCHAPELAGLELSAQEPVSAGTSLVPGSRLHPLLFGTLVCVGSLCANPT